MYLKKFLGGIKIPTYQLKKMGVIEQILEQFNQHKGEFVLLHNKLVRLVCVGDDGEDYYWVVYDGRNVFWHSCLISFVVLKNKIDDKDYNEFIRLAKINHFDQENLFIPSTEEDKEYTKKHSLEHKQKMEEVNGNDKYLTDFCWFIN